MTGNGQRRGRAATRWRWAAGREQPWAAGGRAGGQRREGERCAPVGWGAAGGRGKPCARNNGGGGVETTPLISIQWGLYKKKKIKIKIKRVVRI